MNSFLQFFTNKPIRSFALILFISMVPRLIHYSSTSEKSNFSDSHTYHILAVNLATGNGYSATPSAPYLPNFSRDPAYPFFMSLVYKAYNFHRELTVLEYNKIPLNPKGRLLFFPKEMNWVIFVQVLLSGISCFFFYLILKYLFRPEYALGITLLFCIYFPYFYHDFYILRESFQSSIALIANYFFVSYLYKRKLIYIIFFGILWGILNLTIQVSLVIGIIFPIIILLRTKNIRETLVSTVVASILMLFVVAPYLIRTYNFYSDIKVIKSMGCSITLEKKRYYGTLIKLNNMGYISQEVFDSAKNELWSLTEHKNFEKSFNGDFNRLSNDLLSENEIPFKENIKYSINNSITFAGKIWFKNVYVNPKRSFLNSLKDIDILELLPHFASIVFGLLAVYGLFLYLRETYHILLIFFSIIGIFFIIGDEARRALPTHPYIFMYGIVSIITLYQKLFKRHKIPDTKIKIFLIN